MASSSTRRWTIEEKDLPKDSISRLVWSPRSNLLAGSSWDGSVSVWSVTDDSRTGRLMLRSAAPSREPLLACSWAADGAWLFGGDAAGQAFGFSPERGPARPVAEHRAGICALQVRPAAPKILVTGSWDKTVAFWDMSRPAREPALQLHTPERVYSMDVSADAVQVAVATADRHVALYDRRRPDRALLEARSPLQFQSRCIRLLGQPAGFLLAGVNARSVVTYFPGPDSPKSYTFKSNDDASVAVNDVAMHPVAGPLAIGDSSGAFGIWNHLARKRLFYNTSSTVPVTAVAFSAKGDLLAYSRGNDGIQGCACPPDVRTSLTIIAPYLGSKN